jgi:hypothetical protein
MGPPSPTRGARGEGGRARRRFQFCIERLQNVRRLFRSFPTRSSRQLHNRRNPSPLRERSIAQRRRMRGRFRVKRCCLRRRALPESSRGPRPPLIRPRRAFEVRPSFDGLWGPARGEGGSRQAPTLCRSRGVGHLDGSLVRELRAELGQSSSTFPRIDCYRPESRCVCPSPTYSGRPEISLAN